MRCEVIKYVQSNPEVSSIKSFVGIQLKRNWLNACHVRFSSNVGLSYNVRFSHNTVFFRNQNARYAGTRCMYIRNVHTTKSIYILRKDIFKIF